MAQTKRKRRRKHRGTQRGRIDTRPARGRARSRAEAQQRARSRGSKKKKSGPREPAPPSWSTALKKGGVAAVLFLGLLALMGQPPGTSLVVAVMMLGFYVPLAFVMDRFFYQRHLRKQAQKQMEREQRRAGHAEG